MRPFFARAALCALAGVLNLSLVGVCVAQKPSGMGLRYDPRVLRYDGEKDKLYHASSSVTSAAGQRAGGAVSYHGNRLSAYRYLGRVGQGGIYDALKEDQVRRNLDPVNYQYRTRYWSAH